MFIDLKLSDTILKVKGHISNVLYKDKSPKEIRLLKLHKGAYTPMEDSTTLEENDIPDEGIIYMSFWVPHASILPN
jgi:hypothetical protein